MTDFQQPTCCIICGVPCKHGVLCLAHQGIYAYASWVDQGLITDWDPDIGPGVELLNHRAMLLDPLVAPDPVPVATPTPDPEGGTPDSPDPAPTGWLDQFAVIARRFGYWMGLCVDDDLYDSWPYV